MMLSWVGRIYESEKVSSMMIATRSLLSKRPSDGQPSPSRPVWNQRWENVSWSIAVWSIHFWNIFAAAQDTTLQVSKSFLPEQLFCVLQKLYRIIGISHRVRLRWRLTVFGFQSTRSATLCETEFWPLSSRRRICRRWDFGTQGSWDFATPELETLRVSKNIILMAEVDLFHVFFTVTRNHFLNSDVAQFRNCSIELLKKCGDRMSDGVFENIIWVFIRPSTTFCVGSFDDKPTRTLAGN